MGPELYNQLPDAINNWGRPTTNEAIYELLISASKAVKQQDEQQMS